MSSNIGKFLILAIIFVLSVFGGLLVFRNSLNKKIQFPKPDSKTDLSSNITITESSDNLGLSEKDLYRISDLFIIQTSLNSFTASAKKDYPSSLNELKGTSFGKIPFNDPNGKPYLYTAINNRTDYELSTTLDSGKIYSVKGSTRKNTSALDVHRIADIKSLTAALNGYFLEKKQYPNSLADLVPAGWGLRVNNGPPIIPKDPITKQEYPYRTFNNKKDFLLSAKLDLGISYIFRSDMFGQN